MLVWGALKPLKCMVWSFDVGFAALDPQHEALNPKAQN